MTQALSTLDYTVTTATPEAKTGELEFVVESFNATTNTLTVGVYLQTEDTGTRNVYSVTVAEPVAASVPDGTYYELQISDGTTDRTYYAKYETGTDEDAIAAVLASAADQHPAVAAVVDSTNANQINVTARVPGVALTVTVTAINSADGTTVSGAISATEATPEAGTGKMRLIERTSLKLATKTATDILATQSPRLEVTVTWYNGAASPVQQGAAPTSGFDGPLSFKQLRDVA